MLQSAKSDPVTPMGALRPFAPSVGATFTRVPGPAWLRLAVPGILVTTADSPSEVVGGSRTADVADTLPGILAIFNNVASGREAEFEEWFQHEHLAERVAVPGFLIGRRHEAVSGQPRYFNFYVTQSAEVLKSAAYLGRLDEPTPMTRTVMSEIFKDMIRTVCRRTFRLGAMRGTGVVTVRFSERPAETALKAAIETLMRDKAVACGEIWQAADPLEFPVSMEERLRGGDRKIEVCLLVETLRVPEAEKIAVALANEFPRAKIGVYRLLCEITANGLP
jgi:hypothetical protein